MVFPDEINELIEKYNIIIEETKDSTIIEISKRIKIKDKKTLESFFPNLLILRSKN